MDFGHLRVRSILTLVTISLNTTAPVLAIILTGVGFGSTQTATLSPGLAQVKPTPLEVQSEFIRHVGVSQYPAARQISFVPAGPKLRQSRLRRGHNFRHFPPSPHHVPVGHMQLRIFPTFTPQKSVEAAEHIGRVQLRRQSAINEAAGIQRPFPAVSRLQV